MKPNTQIKNINPKNESDTHGGSWIDGKWVFGLNKTQLNNSINRKLRFDLFDFFISNQIWFYFSLLLLGLILRLFQLDYRAVHHDESLHGYFSYRLYNGEEYSHNPLMHGMLLFHLLSASFFIFGDTDFTLRLPMVLVGTLLIFLPFFLKNYIGQVSAFLISIFLTISPTLVYFSRFARNDILIAFTTVFLIIGIWKYISSGRNFWLYLSAFIISIGFTIKENQYIVLFIFALFFLFISWRQIVDWILSRKRLSEFTREGDVLILLSLLTLPLSAPLISIFQEPLGITLAASSTNHNVTTGSPEGIGYYIATIFSVSLLFLSLFLGWLWKRFEFIKIFLFFLVPFLLIFSNFGTQPHGIATAFWQSLGYWLAQQEVSRGSQPWYYYFFMTSIYEFLPLFFSTCFVIYGLFKSSLKSLIVFLLGILSFTLVFILNSIETSLPISIIITILKLLGFLLFLYFPFTLKFNNFIKFIFFLFFASFIAYTTAGEKMPWLEVHIAIPTIFLASIFISKLFFTSHKKNIEFKYKLYLFLLPLITYWVFWNILLNETGDQTYEFFRIWMILLILGFYFLGTYYVLRKVKFSIIFILLGIFVLLIPFYIRSTTQSSFINNDIPVEPIIYTQTAPHLHKLVDEIEEISDINNLGYKMPITIDSRDGFSWPWQWYLRKFKFVTYKDHTNLDNVNIPKDTKVIVINTHNRIDFLEHKPSNFDNGREFIHRWWFPEEIYRDKKFNDLLNIFINMDSLNKVFDYYLHRKIDKDLGTINAFVFFSKDLKK